MDTTTQQQEWLDRTGWTQVGGEFHYRKGQWRIQVKHPAWFPDGEWEALLYGAWDGAPLLPYGAPHRGTLKSCLAWGMRQV